MTKQLHLFLKTNWEMGLHKRNQTINITKY
jgi:hypothetical protein